MTLSYLSGNRIQGTLLDRTNTILTTKTYNHKDETGSSSNALASNVGGGVLARFGVKIITASPAINTYIKKVKMSLLKVGSPTGTVYCRVRDSVDSVKAIGSFDVSTLTTGFADYEFTLDNTIQIALNDRVLLEYNGGSFSTDYIRCELTTTDIESGYNQTFYDTSYTDNTTETPSITFDSTPSGTVTSIQDGARFEETDTELIYSLKGTPDFSDDFTSYADQTSADNSWIPANTTQARVNISTDVIDFDFRVQSASDEHIYHDLGYNVSDTNWILQFKINLTTTDDNTRSWWGLSSVSTHQNTSQDFIGLLIHETSSVMYFKTCDADGIALPTSGDNQTTITISDSTNYWVRIIRTSSTSYKINIYSDAYTTLLETVYGTCASTTTGLRYISFLNRNDFSDPTTNLIGTIDDVKFYNGISQIPDWWVQQ